MTQCFKKPMIIMFVIISVFFSFGFYHGSAEDNIENFKITLVSFSYGADVTNSMLHFSEDWLKDRYGISKESNLKSVQSEIQAYRYSWLRLHVDISISNIEIKSIYLLCDSEKQDKINLLIDRFEPVMFSKDNDTLQFDGTAVAYIKIGERGENEVEQIVRASKIIAQINYTHYNNEKVSFVKIDTSNANIDRDVSLQQGFQIHMNYCEVHPIAPNKIVHYFATKHKSHDKGVYYLCYYRGVKKKNMNAPVLSVKYSLSEPINNAWVDETNAGMYKKSGDSELPWCDDMYQNESQYAEVRLLIWFESDKTDNEIEEFLRTIQIEAYYSTDSFQYPFDKKELSDGNHNSWRIGPRNRISIDLSNCYIKTYRDNQVQDAFNN